jgi:hypothetical protein
MGHRFAIYLALLLFSITPAWALYETNPGFIEGNTIGVVAESPTQNLPVVYINTYTGEGMNVNPENQWTTVDVSSLVPEGTKAVHLTGRFIITLGSNGGTANLVGHFRKKGSTPDYTYNHQTIEATLGAGQRSTLGVWVPLNELRQFEFKWIRTLIGAYPAYPAYGIALNVDAYMR